MRLLKLSLLLLTSATLYAQSFTPVRELKNLSPEAVKTIHTLESLNALPAGDWRFHTGDVPHGESLALDDSAWTLVQPHSHAPNEAAWYRRLIVVPPTLNGYDLTGANISFQFRAGANGAVPEIVYFNGRRVALGEDLEPIPLIDNAHPGDKILVAVKLLHTVDIKTFDNAVLHITPVTTRPSPDDIRTQIITAANLLPALPTPRKDLLPTLEQAVSVIDLKALAAANQQQFDASLAHAQQILSTLHPELATAKIDLAGNSHIDAAWLWPRSETIDVVKRTFTTALQLMDEYPNYTFSQSAAQYTEWMAEKYPALNEQIRQRVKEGRWEIVGGMWIEPDLNLPGGESLVRQLLVGQRVFQKQYGVTARIGWNPDSFGYNWQLPQIYKRSGLDYFVTQKMHWNDTNTLPFRLFWWESPDGSKVLTYFPTDYVHDNVNPTRVSADFAESADRNPGTTEMLDLYGIGDHGGGPTRAMLDQADHWIAASQAGTSAPESTTKSDAGSSTGSVTKSGAPYLATKSSDVGYAVPTMRYHTAQQYFSSVEKNLNPDSPTWDYDSIAKGYKAPPAAANGALGIPTWNDELYFEYHRGVYTTQALHKASMRKSETATLDAEKLASLAWLDGQPYPASDLTESWKKITFNQFHDLAAGSGIAVIYKDAQRDYTEVFHSDKLITDSSLSTLASTVDTQVQQGVPVIVTNTEAWPRRDTIELTVQTPESATGVQIFAANNHPPRPDGVLPTQIISHDPATHTFHVLAAVNVPAMGYTVLNAAPLQKDSGYGISEIAQVAESASTFTLSNPALDVTIDKKTGCITSLKAGKDRTEYLAPNSCGNQLQTFKDTPKQYDAWNIDPGTLDGTMTPITNLDSIAVTDNGQLRKTVRITRHWQSSKFTQDISLDTGSDTIRITNNIDWHETHVLLKAAFPLAASSPKATYEIPFGSIDRPTTRNNSWEKAQFEVPAMRWADLGDEHQGVSILNDSKYGYDAVGNTLRITLLRSPTWPDPDADRGHQHFVYAIYPHTGSWKQAETVRRGYELNDPLHAQQVFPHTGTLPATHSFASIENPNVTLTAIKKAEDTNALIFRMYEWAGTPSTVTLHIPHGASTATETNLMEKPEGPTLPIANDTITIPIKPYQILTLQATYPTTPSPTK